jgi:hypothetical protein
VVEFSSLVTEGFFFLTKILILNFKAKIILSLG